MKTKAFPRVKVTEKEYLETIRIVKILDIPFAQFAREAYRDKVAELQKNNPKVIESLSQDNFLNK